MDTGVEALIQAAIKLEQDGREFYEDAAAAAVNAPAQKMFLSFAQDEIKHEQWLRELRGKPVSANEQNKALYGRLQGIFAGVPDGERAAVAASDNDLEAINIAIDKEKMTVQAYEALSEKATDDSTRKLCIELVDVEKFHQTALENMIEYFERTADWFMEEEGWSFDGG